jgi:hypothetical protein
MANSTLFWSFTHADDTAEAGRIVRLAYGIVAQVGLLTGVTVRPFVDRETIKWGTPWRADIDQGLRQSRFFVPVLTPRYLQSRFCRNELIRFAGHATGLGLGRLVLPIKYTVDFDGWAPFSLSDPLAIMLADFQWEDFSTVRLSDESSGAWKQAVNVMAERISVVLTQPSRYGGPAPSYFGSLGLTIDLTGDETSTASDLLRQIMQELPERLESFTETLSRSMTAHVDSLRSARPVDDYEYWLHESEGLLSYVLSIQPGIRFIFSVLAEPERESDVNSSRPTIREFLILARSTLDLLAEARTLLARMQTQPQVVSSDNWQQEITISLRYVEDLCYVIGAWIESSSTTASHATEADVRKVAEGMASRQAELRAASQSLNKWGL